ncbi:unnamed protein product, partial [Oppiella nova]
MSDRKKNSRKSTPDEDKVSHKSLKPKKAHKKVVPNQRNSSSESHPLLSQEEFYIMQRRARSLSRSPDKRFDATAGAHTSSSAAAGHYFQSCSHHHFTCSQCGESADKHTVPAI